MKTTRHFYGSRRRFLKSVGTAGTSAALLNSSLAASGLLWSRGALAQEGPAPQRLAIIHVTNGAFPDGWHPATGQNGDFDLPVSTAPFEPFKNQCVFFDGIQGQGGHGAYHYCVTGNKANSIDQYIASKIGQETPFSTLQLAVTPSDNLSHINGRGIPMEMNPYKAFTRLFPAQEEGSGGDKSLARRKGIFNANYEMLKSFQSKLNAAQSERLELHMDSIEKMEQRFERSFLSSQGLGEACKNPVWSGAFSDEDLMNSGAIGEAASDLRTTLHMELIAQAFRCDLTRVASLSFAHSQADVPIPGYGMWHGVIHGYKNEERMPFARRWFSEKIAAFMEQLQKTPDVDGGSVLDNTLIYITSDMGNGSAHDNARTPMMLAGGAGGRLIGGQSINVGGARFEPILDTVSAAMGLDIEVPDYPGYGGGHGPFSGVVG